MDQVWAALGGIMFTCLVLWFFDQMSGVATSLVVLPCIFYGTLLDHFADQNRKNKLYVIKE
jgi:hypothetical protein